MQRPLAEAILRGGRRHSPFRRPAPRELEVLTHRVTVKGPAFMIRLLCVEDDPLMRTYLATRLQAEPDITVVGSVPDTQRAGEVKL